MTAANNPLSPFRVFRAFRGSSPARTARRVCCASARAQRPTSQHDAPHEPPERGNYVAKNAFRDKNLHDWLDAPLPPASSFATQPPISITPTNTQRVLHGLHNAKLRDSPSRTIAVSYKTMGFSTQIAISCMSVQNSQRSLEKTRLNPPRFEHLAGGSPFKTPRGQPPPAPLATPGNSRR